jgi:heterodisulfide reductase subunit A-like polyferredoxin
MNVAMMAIAERLAVEFQDLPNSTVIRVLTDCADEFPDEDALFVEHAVRARLSLVRKVVHQVEHDDHEAVGLSLHDRDRGEEVELTALLIVAANESVTPLSQEEVDRILGVAR